MRRAQPAQLFARAYNAKGRTKFTTSGAHDAIPITSPLKNDLCTEELRDRAQLAKSLDSRARASCAGQFGLRDQSLDEVSLPLRKVRFGCCLYFR